MGVLNPWEEDCLIANWWACESVGLRRADEEFLHNGPRRQLDGQEHCRGHILRLEHSLARGSWRGMRSFVQERSVDITGQNCASPDTVLAFLSID